MLTNLAAFIKLRRKQLGLSQEVLAERAGVSRSLIWMLEKGRNPKTGKPITIMLDTLSALAAALEVNPSKLEKASRGLDPDAPDPSSNVQSVEQIAESVYHLVRQLPIPDSERLVEIIKVYIGSAK